MKQATFRTHWQSYRSLRKGYLPVSFCLLLMITTLAGCTASWRAPVETRGPAASSRSTQPVKPLNVSGYVYRVQRGDTLYGIAWQKGIDYRLVAAWNGIRPPYRIYPGQTLRLSAPTSHRGSSAIAHRSSTQTHALPASRPPARTTATPLPKTTPRTSAKTSKPKQTPSVVRKPTSASSGSQYLAWSWPTRGKIVSPFDAADPSRRGIKIGGRIGNTIQAAESGRVVYSGSGLIGYGRLIIIKHNDKYLSAYGHNRKLLVKEGDQVAKGQKIAEMGTANNGDALLHFEIRRDGKPVDPKGLLPRL